MNKQLVFTSNGHDLRLVRQPSTFFADYNDTKQTERAILFLNEKLKDNDNWQTARELLINNINDDFFTCSSCNKQIKCTLMSNDRRECNDCLNKRKQKYIEERKDLIGKCIVNVDVNWGEELRLHLDDGTTITIADGEYGDDCSEIRKVKKE